MGRALVVVALSLAIVCVTSHAEAADGSTALDSRAALEEWIVESAMEAASAPAPLVPPQQTPPRSSPAVSGWQVVVIVAVVAAAMVAIQRTAHDEDD